jgi:hypothetical protein
MLGIGFFWLLERSEIGEAGSNFIKALLSATTLEMAEHAAKTANFTLPVHYPPTIFHTPNLSAAQLPAQCVAVYGTALSPQRITERFNAFRQVITDPGHRTR